MLVEWRAEQRGGPGMLLDVGLLWRWVQASKTQIAAATQSDATSRLSCSPWSGEDIVVENSRKRTCERWGRRYFHSAMGGFVWGLIGGLISAVLRHFRLLRYGVGAVCLRRQSLSPEYDLSRSLCRPESDTSLNPGMSWLQLQ